MAMILSSVPKDGSVPQNYIFPLEKRPLLRVQKANVPVIDFYNGINIGEQVMKAFQEYGLFQLINHGVQRELMDDAKKVFNEIFELSNEEKLKAIIIGNGDPNYTCKLYTSSFNYANEETHYWREALRHSCNPLEECIEYWPEKPTTYRKTVGAYTQSLSNIGTNILELVSKGLGLEPRYFAGPLSEDEYLTVNHYPSCPDPSLTLGLSKHTDPNLITILNQGHVPGLQLFKDGQWFDVDPLPNSFVVMVGNQLEIVSNGKLKSAVHRAVTNATEARTSAAFFINPSPECIVQPAKELSQGEYNPPLYKPFQYKDFFKVFTGSSAGDPLTVLQSVEINNQI